MNEKKRPSFALRYLINPRCLTIIQFLEERGEPMCVSDITNAMTSKKWKSILNTHCSELDKKNTYSKVNHPMISNILIKMTDLNILLRERKGKFVYYKANSPLIAQLREVNHNLLKIIESYEQSKGTHRSD